MKLTASNERLAVRGGEGDQLLVVGGCSFGLVLVQKADLGDYWKGHGCVAALAAIVAVMEAAVLIFFS